MSRKSNGEGSIRKRSDNLWEARISFYSYEGKFIRKSFYGKTKKESQQKLNEFKLTISQGTYIEPNKMTLSRWLEIWLESRQIELRESTLANYELMIQTHLSKIGHILLKDLQTYQVQSLFTEMKRNGLSDRMVKLSSQILSMALQKAKTEHLISTIATDNIKLPKSDPPKSIQVLEAKEVQHLFTCIKGNRYEALIVLGFTLGMRIGELLALSWRDIDFDKRTLSVTKTLQRIYKQDSSNPKAKTTSLKIQNNTKTKSGNRVLALNDYLIEVLLIHRNLQESEIAAAQHAYKKQDLVFCTEIGTAINLSNFRREFNKIIIAAQLPKIRIHDMRHTHASVFINNGGNLKILQDNLGHSSIKVTADIYSHVSVDTKRELVNTMQNLFVKEAENLYKIAV